MMGNTIAIPHIRGLPIIGVRGAEVNRICRHASHFIARVVRMVGLVGMVG